MRISGCTFGYNEVLAQPSFFVGHSVVRISGYQRGRSAVGVMSVVADVPGEFEDAIARAMPLHALCEYEQLAVAGYGAGHSGGELLVSAAAAGYGAGHSGGFAGSARPRYLENSNR